MATGAGPVLTDFDLADFDSIFDFMIMFGLIDPAVGNFLPCTGLDAPKPGWFREQRGWARQNGGRASGAALKTRAPRMRKPRKSGI